MQVHVNHIKAHVARANLAQDGIQVGPIVIQQSPSLMHHISDLLDLGLEHTKGGGIGQHDAGSLWPQCRLQSVEINVAFFVRGYFPNLVATHDGGGRIGAVGRIRHNDFSPLRITPIFVVGPNHGHPGKFTLSTGHRGQGNALHAGDILQYFLQVVHARQKTLGQAFIG